MRQKYLILENAFYYRKLTKFLIMFTEQNLKKNETKEKNGSRKYGFAWCAVLLDNTRNICDIEILIGISRKRHTSTNWVVFLRCKIANVKFSMKLCYNGDPWIVWLILCETRSTIIYRNWCFIVKKHCYKNVAYHLCLNDCMCCQYDIWRCVLTSVGMFVFVEKVMTQIICALLCLFHQVLLLCRNNKDLLK